MECKACNIFRILPVSNIFGRKDPTIEISLHFLEFARDPNGTFFPNDENGENGACNPGCMFYGIATGFAKNNTMVVRETFIFLDRQMNPIESPNLGGAFFEREPESFVKFTRNEVIQRLEALGSGEPKMP